MIVDYNYKPYVYSAPPGITYYTPPFKNNKGVIVLVGYDNLGNLYNPQITHPDSTGSQLKIDLDIASTIVSGSLNDSYMQFRRESIAASPVVKTTEINMIPYTNIGTSVATTAPYFVPISYISINFNVVGTPSSWERNLTIITLY